MEDFADLYNRSSPEIKNFLYSDDFWFFVDEAEKKYTVSEEQHVQFIYLLQNFAIGAIRFESQGELAENLKTDVGVQADFAPSLAYMIWTRFKPLFENLKKQVEEKQEASRQEQLQSVIAQSQKRESLLRAAQEEQMQQMRKSALDLNRVAGVATSRVPIPTRIKIPIERDDTGEKISAPMHSQKSVRPQSTAVTPPSPQKVIISTEQKEIPQSPSIQKSSSISPSPASEFHAPENAEDEMEQLQYRIIGMPKIQTSPPAKEIPQSPADLDAIQKTNSDKTADLSS